MPTCVCSQEKQQAFDKKLVEERKLRLAARKEQRKEERRNKWLKEREEAEQKARDEALKRGRAETGVLLRRTSVKFKSLKMPRSMWTIQNIMTSS